MGSHRGAAETRLEIPVSDGEIVLDARFVGPAGFETLVVLAHPHPEYGGSMDDAVVVGVRQSCMDLGLAVLRFNFRGVGRSTGKHGGGRAEVADIRAVVDYSKKQLGAKRIVVIGYSFGAWVTLAAKLDVDDQIFLAPPNQAMDFSEISFPPGSLAVAGDCDDYCDVEAMTQACEQAGAEAVVVPGADHFFTLQLVSVARRIQQRLR